MIQALILFLAFAISTFGQNSECLDCHSDSELTTERNGEEFSLYVDENKFNDSIHGELECVDCHEDYDPEELPHYEGTTTVNCSNCHEIELKEFPHLEKNQCYQCHSKHNIQPAAKFKKDALFCESCHNNKSIDAYKKSIHSFVSSDEKKNADCTDCHGKSIHRIKIEKSSLVTKCGVCHENIKKEFIGSLHSKTIKTGIKNTPNCITCHNYHEILPSSNKNSKTYRMKIPRLCVNCHKDNLQKTESLNENDLRNPMDFPELIHGNSLFERGIKVSAVCSDCHTSHNVLPSRNRKSSISKYNIISTCKNCHSRIEKIHINIVEPSLWNKSLDEVPICIDCHKPHINRKVVYEEKFTDKYCLSCHGNENISVNKGEKQRSLYVDYAKFKNSVHKNNTCVKCHSKINIKNKIVCIDSGKVNCAACHAKNVKDYKNSTHGKLYLSGQEDAPYCTDCHGTHSVETKNNINSPTSRKNIPVLCAKCHREGKSAALRYNGREHNIIKNYSMSIHGKGLLESGLMVSATCIDCHTSHKELPASDPSSSVNKKNLPTTCAKCHLGVYQIFKTSIHSPEVSKSKEKLPSCYDCHKSHSIKRVDQKKFRQSIIEQCGQCHWNVTKTYFNTFHGKVSKLGELAAAKCYDCHGSHNILPPKNPNSTLSEKNIVQTCTSCHPKSNKNFVEYLTHATHHDKEKYPYLYYTYLFMTILLISTFLFFGLHTLMWLPRALKERKKGK